MALTAQDRKLHESILRLPSTYAGEEMHEYTHVETITLTASTPAALSVPAGIVDGTNMVAMYEMMVSKNEFSPATGTDAGLSVIIYRDIAGTPELIDQTITEASQVLVPAIPAFRTTDFGIEASQDGTYQVVLRLLYYTPS